MIIYQCDGCKIETIPDNLLRFQVFKKQSAKKLGDTRTACHDMCLQCYNFIFNKDT